MFTGSRANDGEPIRPLRMLSVTRPVHRGSETTTYLESPTTSRLYTAHFYRATTIYGSLKMKIFDKKSLAQVFATVT